MRFWYFCLSPLWVLKVAKRSDLIDAVARKLAFPPTKLKHVPKDGRGPSVVVPPVFPFITGPRMHSLAAILADGGRMLGLKAQGASALLQAIQRDHPIPPPPSPYPCHNTT